MNQLKQIQKDYGVNEATAKRIKNRAKKFGTTIQIAFQQIFGSK